MTTPLNWFKFKLVFISLRSQITFDNMTTTCHQNSTSNFLSLKKGRPGPYPIKGWSYHTVMVTFVLEMNILTLRAFYSMLIFHLLPFTRSYLARLKFQPYCHVRCLLHCHSGHLLLSNMLSQSVQWPEFSVSDFREVSIEILTKFPFSISKF